MATQMQLEVVLAGNHIAPAGCEAETTKELIKTKTGSGNCFCIRVFWIIKLRLIVMSTNLEYRARERERKRESRRQASETQQEKGDRDLGREIKKQTNKQTIVNWVEWLWNLSDSFVICFCGPESAQRSKEFLSFWLYWPIKTLH